MNQKNEYWDRTYQKDLINLILIKYIILFVHKILLNVNNMATKVNVNIRIDKNLKEESSNLAHAMWTNLSTILNMYLIKFNREKRLDISLDQDEITSMNEDEIASLKTLDNFDTFFSSVSWK